MPTDVFDTITEEPKKDIFDTLPETPVVRDVFDQVAPEPPSSTPLTDAAVKAGRAIVSTAKQLIPRSVEAVAGLATPVVGAAHELGQTYDMIRNWFHGVPMDEAQIKAFPEAQFLREADKTPVGSQERYNAAAMMLAQFGMSAGLTHSFLKAPVSATVERGIPRDSVQPAGSTPAAPVTPEEVIPSATTGKEMGAQGETQAPQEKEVISPSTTAAVSGPESPPAAVPSMPEMAPTKDWRDMTAEEMGRLEAQYHNELASDYNEFLGRTQHELWSSVMDLGGLPSKLGKGRTGLTGEFSNLEDAYRSAYRDPVKRKALGLPNPISVFRRDAVGPDTLATSLRDRGFPFETPEDLHSVMSESLASGRQIFGSGESTAKAMAVKGMTVREVPPPKLRAGETQGDLLSTQAEDLKLVGERGTDFEGRQRAQEANEAALKKSDETEQGKLFEKPPPFAEKVETAANDIHKSPDKAPPSVEPPTVNEGNGGAKPPPPTSIYAPDTPPGGEPETYYAMRTTSAFKRWWQKFWPRDLSVQRTTPDSPVITEHQRLIKSDLDYMEKFAKQPWWKALRNRSEEELIDLEHQVVTDYRKHLENGVEPARAWETAVSKSPSDFQTILRHRQSRVPIEIEAANTLGVDPPVYTGDPYLARLTNEEGKDVVDLHPKIGNLGRQIRTTIGSFDNSRVHPTMKEGIAAGTQYEPVRRSVWLRELTSARLESTANLLKALKGKTLFDTPKEALAASPKRQISQVRGLGGQTYYARSPEEAVFLEQNLNMSKGGSPLSRMVQLANTYIRNPSLVNPLPHTTKNMLFKYAMARVGNTRFKADVAEFASAKPSELRARFDKVMPMSETGQRLPQLTAREVGSWAEKITSRGLSINSPSTKFIFAKADPAMRYSLWKSYVRKGMADQEAANHVWLDLIRYDANSGGMSFWKSIPLNFFVPWRTGSYVTLAKQFRSHPIRTLAFVGAVEYLREIRYRKTGRWTHLPVDYLDAPLAESIEGVSKTKDVRSGVKAAEGIAATAATTAIFGPGGSQAPNTIKDVMETVQGDPQNKARVMNMFWGLSQIYNLPREWQAWKRDKNPQHLVNLLTNVAVSEHSSLKYEPRRLMKWLPDWMPGLEKSQQVLYAEQLQERMRERQQKTQDTYAVRHGVSAAMTTSPEEQQLEELERGAGMRSSSGKSIPRMKGMPGGPKGF